MHLSKTAWIVISGLMWLMVGIGLLTSGLHFIVFKAQIDLADTTSWIATLALIFGSREQAALILIVLGLIIGFLKGKFVLGKTAQRVTKHIISLEQPIRFVQVYNKGYLLLIGGMILLGMSMKWLEIPTEIRGTVDVAIGSALMNGSTAYFRMAFLLKKESS